MSSVVWHWFVLLRYDFIGHQETLQDDAEQLLKLLKLEDDIKFPPSYKNMTSPFSVLDWFRTVPLEDRRKLYKLYEKDFKMFGYRKPHTLLDGWDEVTVWTSHSLGFYADKSWEGNYKYLIKWCSVIQSVSDLRGMRGDAQQPC